MTSGRVGAGLALVVLLAGCSGIPAPGSGGPGAPGGAAPTLTPVAVPSTDTPPPEERTLLPGLSAAGVRDPGRLADAHYTALEGRSYTRVGNMTVLSANGTTLTRWDRRLRVAAGWERYRYRRVARTAPSYPVSAYRPELAAWYDGKSVYFRGVDGEDVDYARQSGNSLGDMTRHDRLLALYANFETRVRRAGDGYRLVGTDLENPAALDVPALLSDPRNVTFLAVLGPDGRVERYRLAYDATLDGRPVRVVRTARFSAVGDTDVPEPGWAAEARNATGA